MNPVPEAPRLFAYFDYREYLREAFAFRQVRDPAFTHRRFLRDAGIPGSAYLARVLKASRRLNRKYVPHFARALELTALEQQYFAALVEFGNEKRHDAKHLLLQDLLRIRAADPDFTLRDKRLRFFKRWYYPVVREIISLGGFRGDYKALARMVLPPITAVQAENAVKFLERNGFVARREDGSLHLTEAFVTSGDLVNSTMLDQYHRANLDINREALDLVPPDLRSASSLTLTLSEANFEKVRAEIRAFRTRLMALAREDQNPERVFHIGFLALARSRKRKQEGHHAA